MIGTFILAAIVFCGSYAVLRSKVTLHVNLLFAATKSLTFLLYFSYFSDTLPFSSLDDLTYLKMGRDICTLYWNHGFDHLLHGIHSIVGGKHILYPVFNCMTSLVPADHYQTSVAINAIIASYCAYLFLDIFQITAGFNSKNEFKVFAIFILFMPEFWVWTTLLNYKEAILCTLFAYVYRSFILRRSSQWLIVLFCLVALYYLRYYALLFFVPTFAYLYLWPVCIQSLQGKVRKLDFIYIVLASFCILVFSSNIKEYVYNGLFHINNMFTPDFLGIVRFLITPLAINIHTETVYMFLFSAITPILLCLYFCGILIMITSRDANKIALVIMSVTIIVFYGSIPELSGPRQRLLVSHFNYAIMAFGLQYIMKKVCRFGAICNNIT